MLHYMFIYGVNLLGTNRNPRQNTISVIISPAVSVSINHAWQQKCRKMKAVNGIEQSMVNRGPFFLIANGNWRENLCNRPFFVLKKCQFQSLFLWKWDWDWAVNEQSLTLNTWSFVVKPTKPTFLFSENYQF